jgi:hypothetical protein
MDCLECEVKLTVLTVIIAGDFSFGALVISVSTATTDNDKSPTEVGLMDGVDVSFTDIWQQLFVRPELDWLFDFSDTDMDS